MRRKNSKSTPHRWWKEQWHGIPLTQWLVAAVLLCWRAEIAALFWLGLTLSLGGAALLSLKQSGYGSPGYRFTRHPHLGAKWLIFAGFVVALARPMLMSIFLPLSLLMIWRRTELLDDEKLLRFGPLYSRYMATVPTFFPGFVDWQGAASGADEPRAYGHRSYLLFTATWFTLVFLRSYFW